MQRAPKHETRCRLSRAWSPCRNAKKVSARKRWNRRRKKRERKGVIFARNEFLLLEDQYGVSAQAWQEGDEGVKRFNCFPMKSTYVRWKIDSPLARAETIYASKPMMDFEFSCGMEGVTRDLG